MPRPFKCRRVNCEPGVSYFKPRGIPVSALVEVVLTMDEFESLRLADLECMYQDDAAKCMGVSRQTFGNIIRSAHEKNADALVNGKSIKIEGGVYQMVGMKKFKCCDCSHLWETAYGTRRPVKCPECHNRNVHREEEDRGAGCQGFRSGRRKCERM
jgi:predicted DNA-binding protein (UPF0251 family)